MSQTFSPELQAVKAHIDRYGMTNLDIQTRSILAGRLHAEVTENMRFVDSLRNARDAAGQNIAIVFTSEIKQLQADIAEATTLMGMAKP